MSVGPAHQGKGSMKDRVMKVVPKLTKPLKQFTQLMYSIRHHCLPEKIDVSSGVSVSQAWGEDSIGPRLSPLNNLGLRLGGGGGCIIPEVGRQGYSQVGLGCVSVVMG